jgi:hypothetical protein
MQHFCIAFPIQPGRTRALNDFVETITERWSEYEDFQNRSGVQKVAWFLQSSPDGDQLLIYNEGEDFVRLARDFGASTHPFDDWFAQQLQDITGVDGARSTLRGSQSCYSNTATDARLQLGMLRDRRSMRPSGART